MQDTQENQIYANAFNLIPELGPIKLAKIFKNALRPADVWANGSISDFIAFGIDKKTSEIIVEKKKSIDAEKAFNDSAKHGIQIILQSNRHYPTLLLEIPNPPPLLYIRGRSEVLNELSLAIVGTRKISTYGKQVILSLVPELASRQINVVSGLTIGVDALALQTAVDAQIPSIAVLATSIDDNSLSPKANYTLAKRIMENGCIVSEHSLGSQIFRGNFPVRNRLISGLSAGTLVVEADEESGSLITAHYALEQNRHVFAVPGSIFSHVSRGTNNLIKKGACLVSSARDIVEELNLDLQVPKTPVNVKASTKEEQSVLEALRQQAMSLDTLIRETKMPASQITIAVSMLELSGRIKNLGNGTYARIL